MHWQKASLEFDSYSLTFDNQMFKGKIYIKEAAYSSSKQYHVDFYLFDRYVRSDTAPTVEQCKSIARGWLKELRDKLDAILEEM
jgi:hypothetical protein